MKHIDEYLRWASAAGASLWLGMPDMTRLLLILMSIDILFGLAVGAKKRSLSIGISWDGITKKVGSLILIWVAALFNPYNPIPQISLVQAASAFYIVTELLSITRNASILGIPVFGQLDMVLKYFQGVSGQGVNNADRAVPETPERP